MRLIGVSAPERLAGAFAEVPTWVEQGADCVAALANYLAAERAEFIAVVGELGLLKAPVR